MARIQLILATVVALLFSFTGVSLAASAIDPADGSMDLAKSAYDAITGGHYMYAAAVALVLAVALTRKYFGERWQWMHTDAGAAGMVLAGSFGAALAASLAGGGALTVQLAGSAFAVAFAAAGGYASLKKLVITPLAPHLPAWLQGPVLWLFVHAADPTPEPLHAAQSSR